MTPEAVDARNAQVLQVAAQRLNASARPGQVQMMRHISGAIHDGAYALIQAGTGTGKSLGYLIPAMTHALQTGKRVIVSTATLALQRQIIAKDAPLAADAVEKVTGSRPQVALLKGWQNYLCAQRLAGGYAEPDSLFEAPETNAKSDQSKVETVGQQVVRLRKWAQQTKSGDRDDLVPGVGELAWAAASVSKPECLGTACPLREQCFPERARMVAAQADVVVTNHAMLGIAAAGNTNALPAYAVLIVDEAHELADRVRLQNTVSISTGSVARVAAKMRKCAGKDVTKLEAAGKKLQAALADVSDGRIANAMPAALQQALMSIDFEVRELLANLPQSYKDDLSGSTKNHADIILARAAASELLDIVEAITANDFAQQQNAIWVERGRGGEEPPRLILAPIEVSNSINNKLLDGHSAIFTSATLALNGKFEIMANSLGLNLAEHKWQGIDVGTPFNYSKQGIIYTPVNLPPPGTELSAPALKEMLALTKASKGGMLGLFSSRAAAAQATAFLRANTDLTIYAQGEDQLPTLVEAFAQDSSACLLGTLSLWQGVDVPGRTCRLVIIDRIPFPRPDDPIVQARTEKAQKTRKNGFMTVSAAHAALLLAQGVGRLIRSNTDQGVVAILDSRLRTARYGGFLLRSLPPLWPTSEQAVVMSALTRLAEK